MNADNQYESCIRLLASLSSYPLSDDQVKGYVMVIRPWPIHFAKQVCRIASSTCTKLPVPAELYEIAVRIVDPCPLPHEVFASVLKSIENPPRKVSKPDENGIRQSITCEPVFENHLVAEAIENCGGWRVFAFDDGENIGRLKYQLEQTYKAGVTAFTNRVASKLPQVLMLPECDRVAALIGPQQRLIEAAKMERDGVNREGLKMIAEAMKNARSL